MLKVCENEKALQVGCKDEELNVVVVVNETEDCAE